jgi:hypothetical protein
MSDYEKILGEEIQAAKDLLKKYGYSTDNLWCVEDVQSLFKCTNEQAQGVLNDALQNDATMEQIWFAIRFHAEEEGLEEVEEE